MHYHIRDTKLLAARHALIAGLVATCIGAAQAADPVKIDIAPQPLAAALARFAEQSGVKTLHAADLLAGKTAPRIAGKLMPWQALDALLSGSGLRYRFIAPDAVRIEVASDERAATLPLIEVTARADAPYKAPAATVAGKLPLAPREIPNSISVLTRQQMDDQEMRGIAAAMEQIPGITVIANDTASHQYLARGYTLGVMYDGVTSYNGMTPSHQFDLPLYERIEVLRGPAGLLRGVGEPGGVVNLVRKRPMDTFAASWAASTGSWNNQRVEGDVTGPLNQDKTLRGRFVAASENRNYFYDQTRGDKWLAMTAIEYDLTPATTLAFSHSGQNHDVQAPWSGLPASSVPNANGRYPLLDMPRSTFNAPDWGHTLYHTAETATGIQHRFGNNWILKASYNHRLQRLYYKYAYTSSGVNPNTGQVNYSSLRGDYNYQRDGVDVFADGPFELFGRHHNLLLGFNSEIYNSTGKSGTGPTFANVVFGDLTGLAEPRIAYTAGSENTTTQRGLYSQARLSLADPLTLVLGGRTTTFKAKSRKLAPSAQTAWAEGAKADNEFTPYGGLLFDLNHQITLYSSYADIFVPQTQQKADGGTLEPRTGRQHEIGAKGEFLDGKLAASLAWFNLRDENRAYADPAYPTSSFYLNAGEVESKGWEMEIVGRALPGLDLSAGYTNLTTRYLKDRGNEGKTYSIQSPKHQLKLWGNYTFAATGTLAGFSAGLGLLAQSESQSSRGWRDEVVNTGYAIANGRIAYRIDKTYSLSLLVNNLFDRKYYASVGTPNIYNFYGEPRSFLLTLRAAY